MQDRVLDHLLRTLDGADARGLGRDLDIDLALVRQRLARLSAEGLRVQESPYLAFARRLAGASSSSPELAQSA